MVKDEWKLLQQESISEEWWKNNDESCKRINKFWSNIFKMKDDNGNKNIIILLRYSIFLVILQRPVYSHLDLKQKIDFSTKKLLVCP